MSNKNMRSLYAAIDAGDCALARKLLSQHPELMEDQEADDSWLHQAASNGDTTMVEMLLDMGFNIDAGGDLLSVVGVAISEDQLDMVEWLLERGANPNSARSIITAINNDAPLAYVKLLVEHGADVNQVFLWFNDPKRPFTALSHAIDSGQEDVVKYLRSKGAVLPGQPPPKKSAAVGSSKQSPSRDEAIIAYFEQHFGPVYEKSLREIVPTEPLITIHVIKPDTNRKHVTLFTTGMSAKKMKTPKGGEDFQLAELFIQLPGDWPLTKKLLEDPRYSWSIDWLRNTAKYPHVNQTWLGGPVTIIANDDPPQPLAPNLKFTSMLLLAEHKITGDDGELVQLYRLAPLYSEEHELEMSEGIAALLNAFDAASVPFVVNLNRPNVARLRPGR